MNYYHNNQGQYDVLTNLPNRIHFWEKISAAIVEASNKQTQMALMFLDLDNFKKINDSFGHKKGDEVLKLFVEKVQSGLRAGDICGRWGEDEIAVLLTDISSKEEVAHWLNKIFDLFKQPLDIFGYHIHLNLSTGIAIYPQDGDTEELLIKNTDLALWNVKKQGKNNFQFYHHRLSHNRSHRLAIEHFLYDALENQELALHYQPKLNLKTGEIYGVEALLRWHNPTLGQVSPYEFISVAEEIGLMNKIGDWVLETAVNQLLAWQEAGLPKLQMSVNVSPVQLRDCNFINRLEALLKKTGLPSYLLELEITENCLMEDTECLQHNLNQIFSTGVQVSLDDFGTGYSSLAYLKNFSFHTIKIDQCFVRTLNYNLADSILISAIVSIGHNFNMRVVAEGAETIEHIKLLASLGCDCLQGYWLSKPLPAPEIENFIRNYQHTEQANKMLEILQKYKDKPPLYLIA
jgi:diguanylate cyclase (GGDEF)-like protein